MKMKFINANLLPGYRENKSTTRIIMFLTIAVVLVTLLFRFVYMPLHEIRNNITAEEITYSKLSAQSDYLWSLNNGGSVNESDILIQENLDYIAETKVNIVSRLLNLTSINVEGITVSQIKYNNSLNTLSISITTETDEALLKYIENLWDVYWIEEVEYSTAGPGAVSISVGFTVGEMSDD